MSERICATVLSEAGWRAVVRRPNGYEGVPVSKWGWTPASGPHPLSIAGKRLDTEPGYLGCAEPPESLHAAVARLAAASPASVAAEDLS